MYFTRFLLSTGSGRSSPLSYGDIQPNCWRWVHRQLSQVSPSALLSQTGSGFSAALCSGGSAAFVGSGLLRVSGTGTAFPGDSLSLCVHFCHFIWNLRPSNLVLQAERAPSCVSGLAPSRRWVQVWRPPLTRSWQRKTFEHLTKRSQPQSEQSAFSLNLLPFAPAGHRWSVPLHHWLPTHQERRRVCT